MLSETYISALETFDVVKQVKLHAYPIFWDGQMLRYKNFHQRCFSLFTEIFHLLTCTRLNWQVNAYDHVRVIAALHSSPYFIHIKAKKEERSAADAG